jgi:hypothetical protein
MSRARIVAGALLVVGVLLALVAGRHSASGASRADAPPRGNFSLDQARTFTDFPVYYAGDSVAGLSLSAVERTANDVSFVYGDCVAVDETGCPLPLEVQVWPACVRNFALYQKSPNAPSGQETSIRGVRALTFDDGQRLEVQTRTATIVVFGDTKAIVARAARALRGVNIQDVAAAGLAPPVAGAVEGNLTCG